MTDTDAMLQECLDEVEEVLRSHQYRHLRLRTNAWASTTTRAFKIEGRTITMGLTVDVTAVPEPKSDDQS